MRLETTPEQALLDDTVTRLLDRHYGPRERGAIIESSTGWNVEMWRRFADLGLLGLHIDETYGGAGMTLSETAVVMRAFGRALVVEPYLPTVVLGAGLVARLGTPTQCADLLPQVTSGRRLLAFAHLEPNSSWSRPHITTSAEPHGAGWRLSGQKIAVIGGSCADIVLVSARTPDGRMGVFLADATDTERDCYRTQDDRPGADIRLDDAPATLLGSIDDAAAAIDEVLDFALVLLCAEAVGTQERALDLTVDYLRTREQFGRTIGHFQALQFRAADMYVSLEMARSMLHVALAAAAMETDTRRPMLHSAKLIIDDAARHVTQEAVQLHGGIGMTAEHPIGHYLKRGAVTARILSNSDDLLGRLVSDDMTDGSD